ncbi:MAG: rhodanese-like domain-containing protein [Leptonema illini]|jgi:rhodanese-related sulfurtransferase|uniref:Rhodanese-like protein n=2 Tax=Leptonema illini TaxID=183 RepID=H2CHX4_9LEPT|nr:rhodanese-like domain-containing protein [Leptonema illini]EHQ06996.1 Rhodanese-like protein [Leptonema illini DSM 21528]KAB2934346.1 MAG: rhodanese-like domain-containing protein [Leptonema illini]
MQAEMQQIQPDMTMEQILNLYPSARRALFQKYHIGGCSSCGYSMSDTLEQVLIKHNRAQHVEQAVEDIYESARVDEAMQIEPQALKQALDAGETWRIIDVRDPFETEIATIPGSELLSRELAMDMLQKWPKDTKIVFFCHAGIRSLEATSYFKGHGLVNAKNLKGGIDRWSEEIDPSIPRY